MGLPQLGLLARLETEPRRAFGFSVRLCAFVCVALWVREGECGSVHLLLRSPGELPGRFA